MALSGPTDAALVDRFTAGDETAFRALYERYSARIYTYCLRVAGSPEDAADALQDTFAAAYRRLQAGERPVAHPRAYLFAAARNAALHVMGERRRDDLVDDVPDHAPSGVPPDTES